MQMIRLAASLTIACVLTALICPTAHAQQTGTGGGGTGGGTFGGGTTGGTTGFGNTGGTTGLGGATGGNTTGGNTTGSGSATGAASGASTTANQANPSGSGITAGNTAAQTFVGGNAASNFVGAGLAQQGNSPTANRQFQAIQNTGQVPGSSGQQTGTPRIVPIALRIGFSFPTMSEVSRSEKLAPANVPSLDRFQSRGRGLESVSIEIAGNGVATLTGTVPSADSRRLAANLIRLQPGIRSVNNQLTIAAQ